MGGLGDLGHRTRDIGHGRRDLGDPGYRRSRISYLELRGWIEAEI